MGELEKSNVSATVRSCVGDVSINPVGERLYKNSPLANRNRDPGQLDVYWVQANSHSPFSVGRHPRHCNLNS